MVLCVRNLQSCYDLDGVDRQTISQTKPKSSQDTHTHIHRLTGFFSSFSTYSLWIFCIFCVHLMVSVSQNECRAMSNKQMSTRLAKYEFDCARYYFVVVAFKIHSRLLLPPVNRRTFQSNLNCLDSLVLQRLLSLQMCAFHTEKKMAVKKIKLRMCRRHWQPERLKLNPWPKCHIPYGIFMVI